MINGQIENYGRTGPGFPLPLASHIIRLSQEEVVMGFFVSQR